MKNVNKLALGTAVLAAAASSVLAQSTANPLSSGQKGIYSMVMGSIVAAAQEMPEENYSFKPAPDVRSFGQIVGHIASAQYGFCGAASGEKPERKDIEHTKTSKADLVQALKDAQAYCDTVYGSLTDAKGAETVSFFGHNLAKLNVLSLNTAHADEHYGNLVTYMRIKGIVPPTSQPRGK